MRRLSASAVDAVRLLPVAVEPDASTGLVRVIGPSGFVVDALTLEQAAVLLRMLR